MQTSLNPYNPQIMHRKRPSSKKVPIITLLFIAVTAFVLIRKALVKPAQSDKILPAETQPALFTPSPLPTIKIVRNQPLLPQIESIISKKGGTFSVYIVELSTGKEYAINKEMVVDAASVNKIPILASLYHLVDKEEIDLNRIIVPQEKDIQNYGTGSIQYDKPGTPYSIKTLARLMMEKSDNTAAYLLASVIVGIDEVQKLVESWGMAQTDMISNKTSVKDIFIITEKMYQGEITSPELTREMIDFMDDSDFEDRIPKGVPSTITVYHKTGDEVRTVHDAGIVVLPDRPYFLGVMTTDITSEEETKEQIARISKIVFSQVADL